MPKSKAQADAKAQHTYEYVSILRKFATPPMGIKCIFEIGSYYLYLINCVNKNISTQKHLRQSRLIGQKTMD
jgi:hypothetical protein